MNSGDVRVLFGSTSMLGTGVNTQQRAVCIHLLDTPWRPSDLTQRDSRAIRAGNEIAKLYADNKVDVIIYAVEKSLDSYKFNLLHCKQTFISQLKRGAMGFAQSMRAVLTKTNLKPSNPNLPPSTAKSPLPLLPRMRNRTAKKTNSSPTPKGSKYVITNLRLPARRRQWLRNLFIYMPHVVLSPDYDRETEPAADEIIKCCRFCFYDIKSKMGYKFHDYLILF